MAKTRYLKRDTIKVVFEIHKEKNMDFFT